MADNDEISQEQTEKLLQFQDLTGIENIERCKTILQRHNWDIEVAVQDTFNEQEGAPSVFNEPPPPEPRAPTMNLQPPDQRVYTVQRRQPQGILQWGFHIILFPFRFVYTTLLDILRFVYRLIRPDPRRTYANFPYTVVSRCLALEDQLFCHEINVTDPLGDVLSFIRHFNEEYGVTHPVFYQGTYSQALNDAKREFRFLLVYLHGDDHQDTPTFCRETLSNPEVVEYINARMLFWACNTNSPEGYRVSQALRENTYPFLSLIVLRQNKMTVVARIEGPIGGIELLEKLERVMNDNENSLVAARAERDERNFTQTLRREQDEAYLESLKADQEKEKKKKEELLKIEEEQKRKEDEYNKHLQMLQEREQKKEELKCTIPDEPPIGDPNTVRIVLKLPTGKRVERRFLKTHSLKYLHYFAFCHEECPDDFHIVTNFPRKTLPCEPTDEMAEPPSFEEAGLGKNEMLFVQDNEA